MQEHYRYLSFQQHELARGTPPSTEPDLSQIMLQEKQLHEMLLNLKALGLQLRNKLDDDVRIALEAKLADLTKQKDKAILLLECAQDHAVGTTLCRFAERMHPATAAAHSRAMKGAMSGAWCPWVHAHGIDYPAPDLNVDHFALDLASSRSLALINNGAAYTICGRDDAEALRADEHVDIRGMYECVMRVHIEALKGMSILVYLVERPSPLIIGLDTLRMLGMSISHAKEGTTCWSNRLQCKVPIVELEDGHVGLHLRWSEPLNTTSSSSSDAMSITSGMPIVSWLFRQRGAWEPTDEELEHELEWSWPEVREANRLARLQQSSALEPIEEDR